ncbi:MAG TPA: carbohydrate ABC transporter permease, partial [Ktedonobacterales bacterium]|nr:carbohydrate ABC transporter permease [Ktedonobacterales bacterium]
MANVPLVVESRPPQKEDQARRPIGTRALGPRSIAGYILLIAIAVYCLTPLYWLVVAATKDNTDLFASFGLWFAHFNLWQNLVDTFSQDGGTYPRWLLNSAIYAGVGGFFGMLISVMCGYALAKYKFHGRGLIFGLVL